ncbi:MAG TPA: hypothetical protein VL098_07760 [Flavipsychrobacter sp.]|nr:hypothetical protein [Flavipsychrobacter sp.]
MALFHRITITVSFLLTLYPLAQAQEYRQFLQKNGKIWVEDHLFCLYKEIPIENTNKGSREANFTDYSFYSLDTLPAIYLEARALSTFYSTVDINKDPNLENPEVKVLRNSPRLINYYKIEFPSLQRELNFIFHKETLFYFIKDLVWYSVFLDGKFNEKNAEKLIDKWEKDAVDRIPDESIANGLSMSYLASDFWKKTEEILFEDFRVDFSAKKMYKGDSVIASYSVMNMPDTYHKGVVATYRPHYFIHKNGVTLGEIYSNEKTSYGAFTLRADEKRIVFPMVDKSEQKQVAVALSLLLQMGKLP